MERQPIADSTSVKSMGYDRTARVLEVEYASGRIYDYENVPLEVIVALSEAESVGSFLAKNIKFKYEYTEVK